MDGWMDGLLNMLFHLFPETHPHYVTHLPTQQHTNLSMIFYLSLPVFLLIVQSYSTTSLPLV